MVCTASGWRNKIKCIWVIMTTFIWFIQMRATRNLPRNIHQATNHKPMGTNQFPLTSTMKPTKKFNNLLYLCGKFLRIPSRHVIECPWHFHHSQRSYSFQKFTLDVLVVTQVKLDSGHKLSSLLNGNRGLKCDVIKIY